MARRTVFAILSTTFALALALSIYFQLEDGSTATKREAENRTAIALSTEADWSWPALPVIAPEPTATAIPVNTSPIVRVKAPSIGVDAPIVVRGLNPAGIMEDPPDPVSVVWYSFSARPGASGNVVLAGHVDYHNYGPAVFWKLRNLAVGDHVQINLEDGSSFTYRVASLTYYDAKNAPVGEIVGRTADEVLTMITCGGSFDRRSAEYDKRLVVRAVRV